MALKRLFSKAKNRAFGSVPRKRLFKGMFSAGKRRILEKFHRVRKCNIRGFELIFVYVPEEIKYKNKRHAMHKPSVQGSEIFLKSLPEIAVFKKIPIT